MSKLPAAINNVQADAASLEALTDLVEGQLGNVVGGGYSQYSAHHAKDSQEAEVLT